MRHFGLFLLLIVCAFCSCVQEDAETGDPVIVVDSIQVNHLTIEPQYENKIPYNADVRVFASLYAQQGTLNSFTVRVECDEDAGSERHLRSLTYEQDDVSDNGMTDLDDASLRFKDGVVNTRVEIQTRVTHEDVDELKLKLYLNAGHAGTKEEVVFRIHDYDHDEEED